jgi:hypothetical protein
LLAIDTSDAVEGAGDIDAVLPLDSLFDFEAPGVILQCFLVITLILVNIPDVV